MPSYALSIHTHFNQPARGNPLTGKIGTERTAAPFRNWNERRTEEIYRPNAALGNFERFSFDMNDSLLEWLSQRGQETYQRIVQSVRTHRQDHKTGNFLATPLHQSPLPLLSRRDRLTQLRWGLGAARARFGVEPRGVFLPDFAADMATLQSVVDAGFGYTVLRSSQVEGLPRRWGAGPYAITLPSGSQLAVFVVNDELSESMCLDIDERCGAGHWARRELGTHFRHAGALTLLYIDGEMLGKHRMGEAHFMHYLLNYEAPSVSYQPVTLEAYFNANPIPVGEIELRPYDRQETETQRRVRDALHDLMTEANLLFTEVVGDGAWALRDQNWRNQTTHREMLQSQVMLQEAWANTETDEDTALEHALHCAALSIELIRQATHTDLTGILTDRLPGEYMMALREAQDAFRREISSVAVV